MRGYCTGAGRVRGARTFPGAEGVISPEELTEDVGATGVKGDTVRHMVYELDHTTVEPWNVTT